MYRVRRVTLMAVGWWWGEALKGCSDSREKLVKVG